MKLVSIHIIILLSLLLPHSAAAIVKVDGKIRLSEGWSFVRQDLGSVWEAVRPVRTGQPEEFPIWTHVSLPHCFNATDCVAPDVNYYQGPGWYKILLPVSNPFPAGRTLLEFEGAGQKTDVYVCTEKVASHTGGYDCWKVDITEAVARFEDSPEAARFDGKIPLSIRCDNSRDTEMIPSDISDFNIYGGIYRHLNLLYLPEVSVDEIKITPVLSDDMKTGEVSVECSFLNPDDIRKADVEISVIDPGGRRVSHRLLPDITPLGKLQASLFTLHEPEIWDVDSPRLYTCEVTVTADGRQAKATERFGFRHFEFVDKGPFHLNGRRLLLRGTHRHEDHAGVGAAMTDSMTLREMTLMKEMGVNFIRLGHYQQSERVLDLCDSLGILVWEEIPWCRGGLGGEKYRGQARRMLTNMITQHYNHPSVMIWGLGNENDWPNDFPEFREADIRRFMSELNDLSHSLDPSRKTAIRRCDFASDIVDVYSPSIWAGWYRGDYHQYHDFSKEAFDKVNHFLHVEWGGDSHPGRHSESQEPSKSEWSESYIVRLIDWHLKEQESMPWLTGTAFWPFKDFATPVRPENPVPYVNQKGVLERDLTRKESYYVFQSYWSHQPMLHILGHSNHVRWGEASDEKEILVYSNCPQVELFVNGKSLGVKKRDVADFPGAGLRWNTRLKPGVNEVKAVATAPDRSCLRDSLSWIYQTEKWGEESALSLKKETLSDGNVRIHVTVVDDKGILCPESKAFVSFEIAGDDTLIKDMGTAGASSKVQVADGQASITVRKGSGKSVVAVKSEGLPTQFISLE